MVHTRQSIKTCLVTLLAKPYKDAPLYYPINVFLYFFNETIQRCTLLLSNSALIENFFVF